MCKAEGCNWGPDSTLQRVLLLGMPQSLHHAALPLVAWLYQVPGFEQDLIQIKIRALFLFLSTGENRNIGVYRCESLLCPAANIPLVEGSSATLSLSIFVVFFLCLS